MGRDSDVESIQYPAASIVDSWKRNWMDRRIGNAATRSAVESFGPSRSESALSWKLRDGHRSSGSHPGYELDLSVSSPQCRHPRPAFWRDLSFSV